jgi:integrase
MKVKRLRPALPEPTPDNEYAQLDWLLEQFLCGVEGDSSREGYRSMMSSLKRFFTEFHEDDDHSLDARKFRLSTHINHFTLYDAEQFWRTQGFTSFTRIRYVGNLRQILNFAARRGYMSVREFIEPDLGQGVRETKQRAVYEEHELEFIRRAIQPAIELANRIVTCYKKTGAGADPRVGRFPKEEGSGWKNWDNMVWFFENVLDCRPCLQVNPVPNKIRGFFIAANRYHGGINNVWRRLGVAPLLDLNLIVPLAMKLAWETGLNPESIYRLERDCYRECHELTGQPYIRYYKERSTGEKDLHLALYGNPNESRLPLLSNQAEIIRRTIELVRNLTEPLVTKAGPEDKKYLFLVQPSSKGGTRDCNRAVRLNAGYTRDWKYKISEAMQEIGEAGVPDVLNLARFRATKITQMVRDGYDFFQIQAVAGHASSRTTEEYIDSYRLAPQAQREVSAVLERIHLNKQEFETDPKPYATLGTRHEEGVVYKGVICDCKNVWDPPDAVKRLPVFNQGEPCTLWNMCLRCPNALITKKHLPILAGYERQIKSSLESNNLSHAPNAPLYRIASAVLEGIFREFPESDVIWAREVSECADVYVDAVTYRGVLQ